MQPLLDAARRTILADLADTLRLAALDDSASERLDAALTALLDDVLVQLDGFVQRRGRVSAAGASEFVLLWAWPLIVRHLADILLAHKDAVRFAAALAAQREIALE